LLIPCVRGLRVIVQGRWTQRTCESRSREKHTALEVRVDEIGPSLRWASADVKKRERTTAPEGSEPEEEAPPF
jgi:single-strand DNA-binding protein